MKDYQHEANYLAAILECPELSDVHDFVTDLVLEIAGHVQLFTPEVLRVAWPLIREREVPGDKYFRTISMAIRAILDDEGEETLGQVIANLHEREGKRRPDTLSLVVSNTIN